MEHIGSTAVPGMTAKPVIDVMAPVASLDESRPAIDRVATAGDVHLPYRVDVMHRFCKPSPARLHRTDREGDTDRKTGSVEAALRRLARTD